MVWDIKKIHKKTQSIGQQKKDLGILKIQSQKQPREKVQWDNCGRTGFVYLQKDKAKLVKVFKNRKSCGKKSGRDSHGPDG